MIYRIFLSYTARALAFFSQHTRIKLSNSKQQGTHHLFVRGFVLLSFLIVFSITTPVFGYSITSDSSSRVVEESFSLSPAKIEAEVHPGSSITKEITVRNDLGKDIAFTVEVKDFVAARDSREVIELADGIKGLYSLKDYLEPQITAFALAAGETKIIPVRIAIPEGLSKSGLYGTVLVSAHDPNTPSGNIIASRLGALFFVRVGEGVIADGALTKVTVHNDYTQDGPVQFDLNFRNDGNIHLAPYGSLEIYTLFGKKIDEARIDPFFVLPASIRSKTITWNPHSFRFGRYTAKVSLHRGYTDITDVKKITFWVVSVEALYLAIALILLVLAFAAFRSRKKMITGTAFTVALLVLVGAVQPVVATVMDGTAYSIDADSLNTGGLRSSSTTYRLEATVGEIATGISTSNSYNVKAGYQQLTGSFISLSEPADLVLAPISTVSGGVSEGSLTWTTTTDSNNGYVFRVRAGTNPALRSGSDTIPDYTPAVAGIPDFGWSLGGAEAEFGLTPDGNDTVQKYKDNGSTCNTGSINTENACWYGLSTSDELIAQGSASNYPSGTTTSLHFRAEVGTQSTKDIGSYSVSVIATAFAL